MRMQAAKKVHYDSGPNMTPLVDVVMVILIFLMMVGQFGGMEHYLVSNVPLIVDSGVRNIELDKMKFTVEISVGAPKDGKLVAKFVNRGSVVVPEGSLQDMLINMKKALVQRDTPVDNIQVVISQQRGANVPWMDMVKVYDMALRAEYTKIAFGG